MASIQEFIDSASDGFVAVAMQRNADVAFLSDKTETVDGKVEATQATANSAFVLAEAVREDVIPAVYNVSDLRNPSWPIDTGRPARVQVASSWNPGDGTSIFAWDPVATFGDDGGAVIKEVGVDIGRWVREDISLAAWRTITLEALGAVGRGRIADTVADTAAMKKAITKIRAGWRVVGRGHYHINESIIVDSDRADLWATPASVARMGSLVVEGTVQFPASVAVGFDLIGGQGGASSATLDVYTIIGGGINAAQILVQAFQSGHTVRVREFIGAAVGLKVYGAWCSLFDLGNFLSVKEAIVTDYGPAPYFSTCNACVFRVQHIGGPFNDEREGFESRTLISPKNGAVLQGLNGCVLELMAVEYCRFDGGGIAVQLLSGCHNNRVKFYGEGVPSKAPLASLLVVTGYDNVIDIASMATPNSALHAIRIEGLNNELVGGISMGAAAQGSSTADMGAGQVYIGPGNSWRGRNKVLAHIDTAPTAANLLGNYGLGSYGKENNTGASVSTGLPDASNIQPGMAMEIPDDNQGNLVSPLVTFAATTYARPLYIDVLVKLTRRTGSGSIFLRDNAFGSPRIGDGYSFGLATVGQWFHVRIREIIPPGTTRFRVAFGGRNVDDTDGMGMVWAFPRASFTPSLRTFSGAIPPVPDIISGRALMDPIIPAFHAPAITAGVVDVNFQPMTEITGTAAGVHTLANMPDGWFGLANAVGSDFNLLAGAGTGLTAPFLMQTNGWGLFYRRNGVTYAPR